MMQKSNSHRDAPVRRRSVANAHVAHPSGRGAAVASGESANAEDAPVKRAAGKAASKVPAENESSSTAQKVLRKVGRTVKPVALKVYDALSPLNPASFDLRRRVAVILAAVVLVVTLAGAIVGGNAGSLQAEVADQQAQYDQLQSSNEQTQTALDNREKSLKDYYG